MFDMQKEKFTNSDGTVSRENLTEKFFGFAYYLN